jgi:hypothetical protein
MNLNSPLFDSIRIKSAGDEPRETVGPVCDHPTCKLPGEFRAPKGRDEGKYWKFCLNHVREYNASYNYFAGMSDNAVAAYQKDAVIGHRPTWAMGMNPTTKPTEGAQPPKAREWAYSDPLGVLNGKDFTQGRRHRPDLEPKRRRYTGAARRALDVLGLDETADGPAIKAQYKALVKRFHPDANGGDRSFEERLRDIIKAHDVLKTAGMA